MPVELYYAKPSPAVRAVMLTAHALGVQLDLKFTNLLKLDHMTPEYLKMNPMHTIPTLNDNGFVLFDSHAICCYLVGKYGKNDSLYPKDLKKRAIVDQRMYFDSGILFPRLRDMAYPLLAYNVTHFTAEQVEAVKEAYDFLESLLGDHQWVAGDTMTIADFCCVATVSTLNAFLPDLEMPPKVAAWYRLCQEKISGYQDINQDGVNQYKAIIRSKL